MQQNSLCIATLRRDWLAGPLEHLAASIRQLVIGAPRTKEPVKQPEGSFALALQGGGALGAFTWGVLDRLVEVPGFRPDAVSGASAGAVNAVLLSSGWLNDGPQGAQQALEQFWQRVGHTPSLLRPAPGAFWFDGGNSRFDLPSLAIQMATSVVSPYDLNPLNHNPLRAIVAELVDFDRLRAADAPRLFISATDVETGRARIFDNAELSLDAVLASACLPHLFQAVEIDGRHYWDGGFTANPPLGALLPFKDQSRVVVVLVNPSARAGVPRAARDIASRMNQIVGNAVLQRDLDAFGGHETIAPLENGTNYPASSKYNNDWAFIRHLRDLGRDAADRWTAAQPVNAL